MNKKQRLLLAVLLLSVALLNIIDILTDLDEGATWWHVALEGVMAICAIVAFFVLTKGNIELRETLQQSELKSTELKAELEKWKQVSKIYVEGLSVEIDRQLTIWEFTEAEKDVAFLILKGLSNKEIADVRGKSDKTIRTQANAIYSKSGLSGRSQLSAFFLEDLLLPPNSNYRSSECSNLSTRSDASHLISTIESGKISPSQNDFQ